MGSSILFAPQVDAVQPAFVYNKNNGKGEIKIYFSLSAYNNWEDDFTEVRFSLVDPSSGRSLLASNMHFDSSKNVYYTAIEKNKINHENPCIILNTQNLHELILDKYYQVQIWLAQITDGVTINMSPASQITLIRPFCGFKDCFIEGIDSGENNVYNFNSLTGYFQPFSNTQENIKQYYYEILDMNDKILYTSKIIENEMGLKFHTKINYTLKTGSYKIIIYYTTTNNYAGIVDDKVLTITQGTHHNALDEQNRATILIFIDPELGGIIVDMQINMNILTANDIIVIQRASRDEEYQNWVDMASFKIEKFYANETASLVWQDTTVESEESYRYRILTKSQNSHIVKYMTQKIYQCEAPRLNDIYLSNSNVLMTVGLNPIISGYRYVVQEALTNTLGGAYPIVRSTGDSKYRQFNLSGTLYFTNDTEKNIVDSCGGNYSHFNIGTESPNKLYFSSRMVKNELYKSELKKDLLERKLRNYAIDFLIDKNLKVFRSAEEGNMIVYLSGISFAPNKALDRKIVDFSATVTEICEATPENLQQFNLLREDKNIFTYSLAAIGSAQDSSLTISESQLVNDTLYINAMEVGRLL